MKYKNERIIKLLRYLKEKFGIQEVKYFDVLIITFILRKLNFWGSKN